MPELPEVETICRFFQKALAGHRITKIAVLSAKQFPQPVGNVEGQTIVTVRRCGKTINFQLSGSKVLAIHLKLTGQLLYVPFEPEQLRQPINRVVLVLDDGHAVLFRDQRKFGWMKLISADSKETRPSGIEPLSSDFTAASISPFFQRSRRPVKILLMDQGKIAGIGNIYANEILWRAGISPSRPANKISGEEVEKIVRFSRQVLRQAIEHRGTSAKDDAYIQPNSRPGGFQKFLKVYQRNGQKCARCGGVIKRLELGGRGTFFCPGCQK